MANFVHVLKFHLGNVINRPPRVKAPMVRALTSFIFKGIKLDFRKYMFTNIPGMVQHGLLAPKGL